MSLNYGQYMIKQEVAVFNVPMSMVKPSMSKEVDVNYSATSGAAVRKALRLMLTA